MFYRCVQKANETKDGPVCILEWSLVEDADPAAATTERKEGRKDEKKYLNGNFRAHTAHNLVTICPVSFKFPFLNCPILHLQNKMTRCHLNTDFYVFTEQIMRQDMDWVRVCVNVLMCSSECMYACTKNKRIEALSCDWNWHGAFVHAVLQLLM